MLDRRSSLEARRALAPFAMKHAGLDALDDERVEVGARQVRTLQIGAGEVRARANGF